MEQKFIEELDAFFAVNDTNGAEAHLVKWHEIAKDEKNTPLMVTVLNEMLGFYRSIGDEEKAMNTIMEMQMLIERENLDANPEVGTIYINLGTTLCRFCKHEQGIAYYKKAEEKLQNCDNPYILASLYNNSAAACEAAGNDREAVRHYEKSLALLKLLPDCITFIAITYANMANCYYNVGNKEEMQNCINEMDTILENEDIVRDSGYASACIKCASLHYNIDNQKRCEELTARAEQIYQGGIL